jgi:SAM-dependent methyltransferase
MGLLEALSRFFSHQESLDLIADKSMPLLIRNEGLIRYKLVSTYAENRTVLDIGCGYGYGSYILSQKARLVIGIDTNRNCVDAAKQRYYRNNLNFVHADALQFLKSISSKFDVIVMFEVIEHIWQGEQLLHQAGVSLNENGRVFLSTPNKKYTPIFRRNPYHVRELNYLELRHMFERVFVPDFEAGQIPGVLSFLPIPWLCLGLMPHSSVFANLNNNPAKSRTILISGSMSKNEGARAKSVELP